MTPPNKSAWDLWAEMDHKIHLAQAASICIPLVPQAVGPKASLTADDVGNYLTDIVVLLLSDASSISGQLEVFLRGEESC